MAKALDLIAKAKALPPKASTRSWFSQLPTEQQEAIVAFHAAFKRGEFKAQFDSAACASRWLKEELSLPVNYETIAKYITGDALHGGPRK